MKKVIITGLTLFALVLVSGCGWLQGDDEEDSPAATSTGGNTTSGAAGNKPDLKPLQECGGLASIVEKVMVEQIGCTKNIPIKHKVKGSYFSIKESLSAAEKQAVIESCGYFNKFVEDTGASNCETKSVASRLCFNKSGKWLEDLQKQGYTCKRAAAVPYSQVLEQQGYIKINDKYVKQ